MGTLTLSLYELTFCENGMADDLSDQITVLEGLLAFRTRQKSRLMLPSVATDVEVLRDQVNELQNMVEVLGHWRTYVPRDDFITQRGGTFLLEADDSLLYSHRDRGILGFSATMHRPLAFLEPFLGD